MDQRKLEESSKISVILNHNLFDLFFSCFNIKTYN
uniref:Uncharacterized protein n=1 Tax=Amphimedon queenslandica TaxID=400682 RepID=A0A1X7SNL6_AMPQE